MSTRVIVVGLCLVVGSFAMCVYGDSDNSKSDRGIVTLEMMATRLGSMDDVSDVPAEGRTKLLQNMRTAIVCARGEQRGDIERYVRNSVMCLDRLSSWNFGAPAQQDSLSQRMVMDCLRWSDMLPLRTEAHLVAHLRRNLDADGNAVCGSEWQGLRNTLMEHRLHLWRRVDRTIDASWDANVMLYTNPIDFPGPMLAGKKITRDELERQHKATVEPNQKKADRYNEQSEARDIREMYLPQLRRHIEYAYGIGPVSDDDLDMLDAYLRVYVASMALRSELHQVAREAAKKARAPVATKEAMK